MFISRDQVFISLVDRMIDRRVLDRSFIDEKELAAPITAQIRRLADERLK